MKWTVFASMEQKSSAQVRLLPTWICTAGLGAHGEREIYSATAQGDEYGDQSESLSTLPRCGSFPKPLKWALLPACFFLEKANWEWPAGTVSIAVAGLCQRADLSKDFPHIHPLSGKLSAGRKGPGSKREHKTQYGNMDETWKSESSWCSMVLSAFQTKAIFIPNVRRRDLNANEGRSNMFAYSWNRKLPYTRDLSWSIHYLFNYWFQFLMNKEVQ